MSAEFYMISKVTKRGKFVNLKQGKKYRIWTTDRLDGKHPPEYMYESDDGRTLYDYEPSFFCTESELRSKKLNKLLN